MIPNPRKWFIYERKHWIINNLK